MAAQGPLESCPCASIDIARAKESLQAGKLSICLVSRTMWPFPFRAALLVELHLHP